MSKSISLKDFINDINKDNLYTFNELKKHNNLLPQRLSKSLDEIQPDKILLIDNKPIILFFNEASFNEKYNKKTIFKTCWNFGEAPIVIIENETDFEIYNGFEFILEKKELAELSKDDLSYISILNGDYFKKIKTNNKNKRIDKVLLQNIKDARDLLLKNGLSEYKDIANSLIGRIIFIRYLIDRKVYIEKYDKILSNEDLKYLLDNKEETYELFEYLKSDKGFNGDWFPILKSEDEIVEEKHLKILQDLISGTEISTGQRSLFDIYDFSIIPIEFISNVYESFIGEKEQKKNGAYYTPTFLVDYILKYTVDEFFKKNPGTYNCKVLDPACGSGIFLVETLRKLVSQFKKVNNQEEIQENELKKLVRDNIFGIDKDKDAVNISIFSLYLAMLDYQNPKELTKFKFPNLLKSEKNQKPNFFNNDFFDTEAEYNQILKKRKLDFIIGNPPYGESTIKVGDLCSKYIIRNNIHVGNMDIVQAFMMRVKDFVHNNTCISFITTSTLLYVKSTKKFRNNFLSVFKINHILELSSIRKEIFENANVPVSIFFYEYGSENNIKRNIIKYISIKPTKYFKNLKILLLTKQDFKKIIQVKLLEYDYLWKVLVYGSYLDFNLIKKLKMDKSITIQKLVDEKKLIKYQGFKRKDGNKKIDTSDLINYDFVDTSPTKKDLKPFYISNKLEKFTYNHVGYINKTLDNDYTNLYKAPILLFTGGLNKELKQNSAISYKNVTFTSSVVALKSLSNNINILKNINGLFYSSYFSYYLLQTASSTGIRQEECNDYEKLSIQYIDNTNISKLVSKIETLKKDFYDSGELEFSCDYEKKLRLLLKELDNTVLESFNLSEQEYSLVDYANNIIIPWVIQKKYDIAFKKMKYKDKVLNEYINIFIKHFSKIYEQNGMYFQAKVLWDKYAIGIYFEVVDNEPKEIISWEKEVNIQNFLKKSGKHTLENLFLQKDVKGFEEDGFYVIKPNEYKNWHKAIGYLDFYEFRDAILRAGKKGI